MVNGLPVVDEHARESEEEGEETQLQVPDHQRRLTALLHQFLVVDPRETRRETGRQNGQQTEGLVMLRGRGYGGLVRQLYEGDAASEEEEAAPLPGGQAAAHQEHGKAGRCQDFQLVGHLKNETKRLIANPAEKRK